MREREREKVRVKLKVGEGMQVINDNLGGGLKEWEWVRERLQPTSAEPSKA